MSSARHHRPNDWAGAVAPGGDCLLPESWVDDSGDLNAADLLQKILVVAGMLLLVCRGVYARPVVGGER